MDNYRSTPHFNPPLAFFFSILTKHKYLTKKIFFYSKCLRIIHLPHKIQEHNHDEKTQIEIVREQILGKKETQKDSLLIQ